MLSENPYTSPDSTAVDRQRRIRSLQRSRWTAIAVGLVALLAGPLMTVLGMVAAFRKIATESSPEPQGLADGIATSLAFTFFGLSVAIIAIGFWFWCTLRIRRESRQESDRP